MESDSNQTITIEYQIKRRKFVNLKKKPKKLKSDYELSTQYSKKAKSVFMEMLASKSITAEQIEQYNLDWYNWLYNLFNPTSTRAFNKVIYLEDIPFYSKDLLSNYEDIYSALIHKVNPLPFEFRKLTLNFLPRTFNQDNIDTKFLDNLNNYGAFCYVLPKEYSFFEFSVEGKEILSFNEIRFNKTKAITLPKGILYWGYLTKGNKPIFLGYFSMEEFEKKSNIKGIDRKRLLENNLKERGFISNFVEGTMVWNLDEIPKNKEVLLISLRDSFFRSILFKR